MKQNLKKTALAIGILALGIAGCKKEAMNLSPNLTDFSESEIQSLALQTEVENSSIEIRYDEATAQMNAETDGLAADYLVSVSDFDDNGRLAGSDPDRNDIRKRSFIPCLKDMNLDSAQFRRIKVALGNYEDCKVSSLKRARTIHLELQKKYKAMALVQVKLLKDSVISKQEYNESILRLKKAFLNELREAQIENKVNLNLRECHEKLLRQLHNLLTEKQWKVFMECRRK